MQTTQPTKIALESFGKKFEYTGHWDSTFLDLIDAFLSMCSGIGFADKNELYKSIYYYVKDSGLIEDESEEE